MTERNNIELNLSIERKVPEINMKIEPFTETKIIYERNHAEQYNLEFKSSGHTGFASTSHLPFVANGALMIWVDSINSFVNSGIEIMQEIIIPQSLLNTIEFIQIDIASLEFLKDVNYDSTNGDWTYVFRDGSRKIINVPIDNFLANIEYNPETKDITFHMTDGTIFTINISDMIDIYEAKVNGGLGLDGNKFYILPKGITLNMLSNEIDDYFSKKINEKIQEIQLNNQNLLHNWDFRNPVNQRSKTIYTGSTVQYTIDRWLGRQYSEIALVLNGIRIAKGITANNMESMVQVIEPRNGFVGKTLTLSSFIEEKILGNVFFVLGFQTASGDFINQLVIQPQQSDMFVQGSFVVPTNTGRIYVAIWSYSEETRVIISRIKLELGFISTLANDPPQDYGVELAKCQRYQNVLSSGSTTVAIDGVVIDLNRVQFTLYTPVPMRITPAIENSQNLSIQVISSGGGLTEYNDFTYSVMAKSSNILLIQGIKNNHGIILGSIIRLVILPTDRTVIFDSNL